MDLRTYLASLSSEDRNELAHQCGTSRGHLQNVAYGYRPCAPELAVLIEQQSREVTRKDLRPDDWEAIWPELSTPTEAH